MAHTFRSEFDAAIDAGRQAVALTEADPRVRSDFSLIGLMLVAADRADEARTVTENGRRRAMEQGEVVTLSSQQLVLAFIAWASGRWDDAATEIDAMTGLAEDFGLRVGDPMGHAVLGNIAFHRGDLATAQTHLDAGRVVGTRGGMLPRTLLARLSALMLEAEGDTEGALAVLLEAFEFGQALGIDTVRSQLGVECVRVVAAAGKLDRAEAVAIDLAEFAQRAASSGARGAALFARGTIDGNGELLGEAAQEFAAAGRPIFRVRALDAAARAHAEAGEREEATASAREALAVADGLGAVHDSRRITAFLRELGVRIGAKEQVMQATHGWDSLTAAERDVAELVGEGLRNREIADRLFISRRTVESHMSRLYTKLGAENRVALARVIREHETGRPNPAEEVR